MAKPSCLPALFAVGVMILCLSTANATIYTGSLSYTPPYPADTADGLWVDGVPTQWRTYTVTMSWTVTDQDNSYPGFPWKYTYTFGHNGGQAGISHIIIEGSEGISIDDIAGLTGASITSIGLQTVQSGNEGMPEDLVGIRFNPPSESPFSMTWSFYSDRAPVWGDFYARCGNKQNLGVNRAYNYNKDSLGVERGFLDIDGNDSVRDDTDPSAGPSNGSIDYHILRPDSVVPEPATLGLLLLSGLPLFRRKTA